MKSQIKVPAVGESITEGTIGSWSKKDGDYVKRDEVLMILETDKASVEVVAEADGVLSTKAKAGEVVKVGAVIGEIDGDAKAPAKAAPAASAPAGATAKATPPPVQPQPIHAKTVSKSETMSPAVRRVVSEGGLDAESIPATGKGGRLTKADAMGASASVTSAPAGATSPAAAPISYLKSPSKTSVGEEIVREPMTTIRKRIAERLVEAQHTAAILTTFNEIDMTNVMALRTKYKEKFEKKYGISLGFMGFFVKAVIEALKDHPKVNAFIDGTDIVYHNYHHIGVAVGSPKGLLVPVVKHAGDMTLAEIEMAIKHYGQKARDGKISLDDLNGGTFTISNGGVYGSLMSTPILNPPQSGILGMHKIEERPIAVNGEVKIRPMMYVALSYDHRIIDGSESVTFLVRVKDCIEDPTRLLLEI